SPLEVPPSEADDTGLHDVQIDEARKQDGPGGGGRKARDSGKNKQHGDGGRFGKNEEKHLEQLYDKRDNAPTRAERTDAKRKIKNIVRNAKRKNRGENHSMRPKR
ncbi:MAG: hypothetical protein VYB54_00960, partial [Pseudomonadota bacterium]|nr:hypothetical protein [Pseudomonadota bacterium]